jgi:hypothetical protein
MMRRRERRQQPTEIALSKEHDAVTAIVPVTHGSSVRCSLHLEYCASDPLVVTVALRAPSGSAVAERVMLRKDVRAAMFTTIAQHDLVASPGDGRSGMQLVFREGRVAIGVIVPGRTVQEFLDVAGSIVPFSEQSEADAVGRALEQLIRH